MLDLDKLITEKDTIVLSWKKTQPEAIGRLIADGWCWRNRRERIMLDHGRKVQFLMFEHGYERLEGRMVDHIIIIGEPPKQNWYAIASIMGAQMTHVSEEEIRELG